MVPLLCLWITGIMLVQWFRVLLPSTILVLHYSRNRSFHYYMFKRSCRWVVTGRLRFIFFILVGCRNIMIDSVLVSIELQNLWVIQWGIQTLSLGGGPVLISLLSQLFFLQSFLHFSPKIRGHPGPSPRSVTVIQRCSKVGELSSTVLKGRVKFRAFHQIWIILLCCGLTTSNKNSYQDLIFLVGNCSFAPYQRCQNKQNVPQKALLTSCIRLHRVLQN